MVDILDRPSRNIITRDNIKINDILERPERKIFDQKQEIKEEEIDIDENDVGVIESVLSGIVSGLIKIPEGAVSLGASLYDLGADTNTAAKVEKFFDDINPFDEKAEATTAGKITETLVNLGVPGGIAFSKGASLANKVLKSKKLGKYFTLKNDPLKKAAEKAAELNTKGKVTKFAAGSLGAGVAEGVFVGDVEKVGTFGDLLGGPTKLKRQDDEYDPSREILNRVKFGTEGALFSGVIGGVGASIKKIAKTGEDLARSNSKIDKVLESISSKVRSRSKKAVEYFKIDRKIKGLRSADINLAEEISRNLDKNINAIFPSIKGVLDVNQGKEKNKILKKINDLLLSGTPKVEGVGDELTVKFGPLNKTLKEQVSKLLKNNTASQENIDNIFSQLEQIRGGWGLMFQALGSQMPKNTLNMFKKNFGDKFQSFLNNTYEVFENKSLIPFKGYKPAKQNIDKLANQFKILAKQKGETLTDEGAEYYVNEIIRTAKPPKGLSFRKDSSPEVVFKLPKEILNSSFVDDIDKVRRSGFTSLSNLTPNAKELVEKVLGKINNPVATILNGTERLSMLSRQNQFFQELMNQSNNLIKQGKRGMFYKNEREAIDAFGEGNVSIVEFLDPGRTYDAGIPNPVSGTYTSKGMAEALTEVDKGILSNDSAIGYVYNNFLLLPKATSQMAKTILSPITHIRNFFSAGAFAFANGIVPNKSAMKIAYSALQVPGIGARKENELYRRLLELGVVNSNVRVGDLKRMIGDITFLDDTNFNKYLGAFYKAAKKGQKIAEDFYTAEDDFWKITTWASEKARLTKAYQKAGMDVNAMAKQIEEEAADIVRNNVPNYDYVSDFVKQLRKFPLGNFVSFPAEIMRTGTNIVNRAIKEIKDPVTGSMNYFKSTNPLKNIGIQRLLGFSFVTSAVPFGLQQGAKVLQNVSDEDMEALRRYVPDWSKNSTLIPILDNETGKLKYIDFSHANAYDTLTRPIQTVVNAVSSGDNTESGIMDDFMLGVGEATKELASPFISESIWAEAFNDILIRRGRTRDGKELYTEQTAPGEKIRIIFKHLVETQTPGSLPAFKRVGLAISGERDPEYGKSYELGDELGGFVGLRAVEINPVESINFKIAEFQTGLRNSRREFTRPLLRGGEVSPGEIVDRYIIANQQAFKVKQKIYKDYLAAIRLGANPNELEEVFENRRAKTELEELLEGSFKPFNIAEGIEDAFERNAEKINKVNSYPIVEDYLKTIYDFFDNIPLSLESLPAFPNPYKDIELSPTDTSYLPPSGQPLVGPNSNLNTQAIAQKGQQVFGSNDPIFGG